MTERRDEVIWVDGPDWLHGPETLCDSVSGGKLIEPHDSYCVFIKLKEIRCRAYMLTPILMSS